METKTDKVLMVIGITGLFVGIMCIAVMLVGYGSAMEQVALNEELQEDFRDANYEISILHQLIKESKEEKDTLYQIIEECQKVEQELEEIKEEVKEEAVAPKKPQGEE